MELEQRVASAIRSGTEALEPFVPDVDAIRRAGRRRSRLHATLVVGGVATATALVVIAVSGVPPLDRGIAPVDEPDRGGPRIVRVPDVRAEQMVLTPTVASTMTPGAELVADLSSEDPDYNGSGELIVPLDVSFTSRWEITCSGALDLRYVVLVEPEALYYSSGRCDGAAESSVVDYESVTPDTRVRFFVTSEDTADFRRCFTYSPPQGCDSVEPAPARRSGAIMRMRVHEERDGPVAAVMFGRQLHARDVAFGSTYSLTKVAAGASGSSELSFRVEDSDADRIAQAVLGSTGSWEECAQEASSNRAVERCDPTVELLIDGSPVGHQSEGPFSGTAGWGSLAAGDEHVVTLRVVEGDPRNVDLGVLVYEEDR